MTTASPTTPQTAAPAAQRVATAPAAPHAASGLSRGSEKAVKPDAVVLLQSIDRSLAVIRLCAVFIAGLVALGVMLAGGSFLYGLVGPTGIVALVGVIGIGFVVIRGIDRK